ncbi:hypothetical protein [Providencia stuartii]|uniref:hypothetical protein n=1 Tax=Providencia stuartii TaxID=588 RepID=UPI00149532C9|nr:hypothetical protein [Providencia stuartii]NPD43876.1 hypothetical protein [Providencia stuartii]NPD97180.1 hypothetical protein [Providencia stuartii]
MFERNKDLEQLYDDSQIISGWKIRYVPILYVLNVIESLHVKPPNGRLTSRREKLIWNLNLSDYSRCNSVSNAVNDYISSAVSFLSKEKERIRNRAKNYPCNLLSIEDLIDFHQEAMTKVIPLPGIFTRFECGWFVYLNSCHVCFLDSSLKDNYHEIPKLLKTKLVLCVVSNDFTNEEITQLFKLGPVTRVILMDSGGYVNTYSSLSLFDAFISEMEGFKWNVNRERSKFYIIDDNLRGKVTPSVKNIIRKIKNQKTELSIYFDYGIKSEYVTFHLNSIRSACENLILLLLGDEFCNQYRAIQSIESFVNNCIYRVDCIQEIQSLENDIFKYTRIISQNKYLYKIEQDSALFHETNIAGIYKELLQAKYNKKSIQFTQEELSGNGRTDIQIKRNKETIGIIEVKLLKQGSENRTEKIREGLDQLYERYSQNHYRPIGNDMILKLVLFCYDPNMRNLVNTVTNAIAEHEKRVHVKFTTYDTNRPNVLRIKLEETTRPLRTRIEYIDIVIVKLENKYNRDRLANKGFKIP